jgi:hypothetical protein
MHEKTPINTLAADVPGSGAAGCPPAEDPELEHAPAANATTEAGCIP